MYEFKIVFLSTIRKENLDHFHTCDIDQIIYLILSVSLRQYVCDKIEFLPP